jgi:uncharacterized protein YgbK (DUF1537 family)
LPKGLLLAWYGDDFTGAAAVAEVLDFAGFPAALFLAPPGEGDLARAGKGLRAIGLASTARAETPRWMGRHLPGVFDWLAATRAAILHYKVCSTMDSAPHIGSIGRALEIGLARTGAPFAPILFAAPDFGRYQAFGQLFAKGPSGVARIDRHEAMARHPVTPIDEADVCRFLSRQPRLPLAALHLPDLGREGLDTLAAKGARGIALDLISEAGLAQIGALIWSLAGRPNLVIGSQGVESALVAHWRDAGLAPPSPPRAAVPRAERIAVLCGSVSPVTARQIARARAAGFASVPVEAARLFGREAKAERERGVRAALSALAEGRNPILFTAQGPDDPAVARARRAAAQAGLPRDKAEAKIGTALGAILARLFAETPLRRAVAAGGDTSGRAARALGLLALRPLAYIAPGASLMRAIPRDAAGREIELVLKGGQMGQDDLFLRALGGR